MSIRSIQESKSEDLHELKELLKQTNDLNDLMRGYIRTNMDKATAEKLTFETEIDNIKTTSKQVTDQMLSILTKQERLLNGAVQTLQKVMTEAHGEMKQNNSLTLQKMGQIEGSLNKGMTEIKSHMQTEINNMSKNSQSKMNELEVNSRKLVQNARKGVLINDWLDVAKYGLGSLAFNVPVLAALYYFFVK